VDGATYSASLAATLFRRRGSTWYTADMEDAGNASWDPPLSDGGFGTIDTLGRSSTGFGGCLNDAARCFLLKKVPPTPKMLSLTVAAAAGLSASSKLATLLRRDCKKMDEKKIATAAKYGLFAYLSVRREELTKF
jgi:hypothetical protein